MKRYVTMGIPVDVRRRRNSLSLALACACVAALGISCSSGESTTAGSATVTGIANTSSGQTAPPAAAADEVTTPTVFPVDIDGIVAAIELQRGHVVVVDFWATWCGPCVERLPHLGTWIEKYGRENLAAVAVSLDLEEDLESKVLPFLNARGTMGIDYLLYTGGDHTGMVNGIDPDWTGEVPALFLYDRTGRLRHSLSGEPDISEIEALIGALVNEQTG